MVALFLDTCSERSLLFFYGSELLFVREFPFGFDNSRYLFPAMQEGLKTLNLSSQELSFIAVGTGPGSYTGMRVGASAAKGLAFGCHVPLIGLPSLASYMPDQDGKFVVLVDAKIRGAYTLCGICEGGSVRLTSDVQAVPLEKLGIVLQEAGTLITPNDKMLKPKISALFPHLQCHWQVSAQNPHLMAKYGFRLFKQDSFHTHKELELLYLQ